MSKADVSSRKVIFLSLCALVIAVRLIFLFGLGANTVRFADGPDYLKIAASVCQTSEYPSEADVPFFRPPLYPLSLAAVSFCEAHQIARLKLLNTLLDLLSLFCLLALLEKVFNSTKVAMVGGLFFAIDPAIAYQASDIRSESLFMMLLIAAICALVFSLSLSTRKSLVFGFAAGALLALSALTRPSSLALIPLFLCGLRTKKLQVISVTLGIACVLSPWVYRNYTTFGELIIVNDGAGHNLWRGTHPTLYKFSSTGRPEHFLKRAKEFDDGIVTPITQKLKTKKLSPRKRESVWLKMAFRNIQKNPGKVLEYWLWKAKMLWQPWLNVSAHGTKAYFAGLWFIPLYLASFLGLKHLYGANRATFWWILFYCLVVTLAHIPFQAVVRFRIPYVNFIMHGLAAYGLLSTINTSSRSNTLRI